MKRRILLMALLCLALLPITGGVQAVAQPKWNSAYQAYIDEYADLAVDQMKRYGVPASITLAQALLESGAGRSTLATKGNNHFGIKCHGWTGRTIAVDDDKRNECFRAYKSVKDSYEDHSTYLASGQRYRDLFKLKVTDYKGWAHGLKRAGYATNPKYATLLIDIIELYGLDKYDSGKKVRQQAAYGPHTIHKMGKNYYIFTRDGDTFKNIAKEVGVSSRKLAKYNERNKRDVLADGEIIWLKKKATKAPKEYKGYVHIVKAGESMYTIAQTYGITIKALYKINRMPSSYRIQVGDELLVR